ncbi:PQQ-binding-like beta-propeller repeat protein [Streptomyces sp. NPDC047028]|uniref:outer membrane protein assembly factor BamB family protein n=1 Tax=Streptomyces sp. NPDC047028 TaxID=3155793 RepID=UPI0033E95ACB
MTQPPPPPPNQPPQQGGFGPPQNQPAPPPAAPATPPPPAPATPPPAAPATPPSLQKGQESQPPQPPQPQPGYGYPQAPQPGYGYPQAPQPPQPPAGYGYPGGQPQNPYGAPPTPAYGQPPTPAYGQPPTPAYGQPTQPGYGYPGGPNTPMQPQPGQSGGGRNNTTLIIVVAAVAAIALIVGGGVWYAKSSGGDDNKTHNTASSSGGKSGGKNGTGGGSGGTSSGGKEKAPSDPSAKTLFQVDMPKVKDTVVTDGSWLTDKVYAKSGVAEINGYDPAKGTKLWTIKLPGPVCAASQHVTADGKTAVAFQPKMPAAHSSAGCSKVAAIDLDAGTKLWTKSVDSGDYPINFSNVTVSQHTVAVGSTSGGAAWNIDSGKQLWQPKPDDTCYDAGYGGGAKLVAVRKCGDYDSRELHIQTIDPNSGKVISEYKMTSGIEYASVVSTDPLVVAADVGDSAGDGSGISDYFSIDNKTGKLLTRISAPGKQYGGDCDGITQVEGCKQIVVGNGKLYVPTEEHDGSGDSYSQTNEIIAFDLSTGKQTGQRADAGDGYTISPLRMDGTNLLAYKQPPYDKGAQVVSIDGGSFKETTLLETAATEAVQHIEISMQPDFAEILFGNGRLYMSAVYADKPDSVSKDKDYLAAAFGVDG